MLSILWTILIGFIAGVIAKFVTPGSTYEPKASFSLQPLALSVPWSRPTSDRPLAGIRLVTEPASSLASWAQWFILLVWGFIGPPRIIARPAPEKSRFPLFRAPS